MKKPRSRAPRARSSPEYWILDRAQIRCLASAPRQDMVDRLAAEGPMSVRELAGAIGMRPSALYHHLSALRRVGLVVEAGTRLVSRRREALFATPSPRMRLRRALSDPTLRGLMRDVVAGLCRQMERDFARGLASGTGRPEGPARNLGFFRLVGRPGPRRLAQVNARLDELSELLWHASDPKAPLVALAWTLTPIRASAGGKGSK